MDKTGKAKQEFADERDVWTPPPLSTFLKAWLEHDLSMAREADRSLAVFAVRIDEYLELSTRFARNVLEAAIAELAARLKNVLRPADALVRCGEDSFAIIHCFSGDLLALHDTAKTILKRMQQSVRLDTDDRRLAASIGVAFYPEDGNSAELLLERAHNALKRTDAWGGNGFCFYSRSSARQIADDLSKPRRLSPRLGWRRLTPAFSGLSTIFRGTARLPCLQICPGKTPDVMT